MEYRHHDRPVGQVIAGIEIQRRLDGKGRGADMNRDVFA